MNLTPEAASELILVIDDDSGFASLLADLLTDQGYRVMTARNGLEALAAVAGERPSLVLTDWMMPIMNGPQFIEQWRQREPESMNIPTIIMSSAQRPVETLTGVRFLLKPFALDVVLTLIQSLLIAPGPHELGDDVLAIQPLAPH